MQCQGQSKTCLKNFAMNKIELFVVMVIIKCESSNNLKNRLQNGRGKVKIKQINDYSSCFLFHFIFVQSTEETTGSKLVDKFEPPGINFKAKVIGIVDVPEARGDQMCLENMGKLKVWVM